MLTRIRKAMDEKDQGFTLIELLVVMIIIGILAAIAIPIFLNQRNNGYDSQARSDVRNLAIQVESYFTENSEYPTLVANAAAPATPAADTVYYTASDNTSVITGVVLVDSTGTATETTGTVAFCVETTSDSTTVFSYNSALGGLQPAGTGCP